jgi:peptide/nickel transport system permease protein
MSASRRVWLEMRRNRLAGVGLVFLTAVVLMAIFAPWVTPYEPQQQNLLFRNESPSRDYLLGTDDRGRDVLTRLAYGARVSLFIGIVGTAGGVLAGTIIGITAGYFGRWIDQLLMRIVDVMLAFPGILLALLIIAVLGPSIWNLIIAIAIWGTPTLARIVRGTVLSLREQEFIEAARSIGATPTRVMTVHLLPNSAAPIIVYATIGVAAAILTAAGLGFLGLGVQPPTAEWGQMLSGGRQYLRNAPHLVMAPGLAIFFTLLALNFIGDALRDALDPHLSN